MSRSTPDIRVSPFPVNHLLDTGRRRIGYIGMEYPLAMHINRYRAYESGLRDAGRAEHEDELTSSFSALF